MTNGGAVSDGVIDIGSAIYEARVGRKMTQRSVAKSAGLGHSHLNYIERGTTSPSVWTLEKLSRSLDLKVSELFGNGDRRHSRHSRRRRLSAEDTMFMDKLRTYTGDVDDRHRVSRIVKQMIARTNR